MAQRMAALKAPSIPGMELDNPKAVLAAHFAIVLL